MALIPYIDTPGEKDPPITVSGAELREMYCGDVQCDCSMGHLVVGNFGVSVDLGTGRVDHMGGHMQQSEPLRQLTAQELRQNPDVLSRMRSHYAKVREFGKTFHFHYVDWTKLEKDKFVVWADVFRADGPVAFDLNFKAEQPKGDGSTEEKSAVVAVVLSDAYCVNPKCDCHKVLLQVAQGPKGQPIRRIGTLTLQTQTREPRVLEVAPGEDPNYLFMVISSMVRDVPKLVDFYEERYQQLRLALPPIIQRQKLALVERSRLITQETPGRNDPCYCGSGKKFKRCHGA